MVAYMSQWPVQQAVSTNIYNVKQLAPIFTMMAICLLSRQFKGKCGTNMGKRLDGVK